MKSRRIVAFLAAVLLLGGVCTASGAAGDRSDPLLSKRYVDGEFTQSVLSDTRKAVEFSLAQLKNEGAASGTKSTGAFSVKNVASGSTAALGLGDCIILLSGAARVEIRSGALVNVSVGAEAVSGTLVKNSRYLGCEDLDAVVTFSADSRIAVDGSVEISGGSGAVSPFTDVQPKDWFHNDVLAAVQRGLVNGMTPTTYEPSGTLTAAQCVKLASCMHQLYNTGSVTLVNSPKGAKWYRSYVDYALQNGILTQEFDNYDAALSRQQFVEIFYRALPGSTYTAINSIADGAIPDVGISDAAAAEIYAFYRAGILTGYTNSVSYADHAFGPQSTISRAEVAAIMNRMFDPAARKQFTIG